MESHPSNANRILTQLLANTSTGRLKCRFRPTGTACEWGEEYRPGGYHPVHLGDVLHNRYAIIRKLGYGSFSTVWLAADMRNSASPYVAIKINKACPKTINSRQELDMYSRIACLSNKNATGIVALLDTFDHQGPNGKHVCLVLELMGPDAQTILRLSPMYHPDPRVPWDPPRFPAQLIKRTLRDVLIGLNTLHEHGIVHGGLHLGSILLQANGVQSMTSSELGHQYSQCNALVRLDGQSDPFAPVYLLEPQPLINHATMQEACVAKIANLGAAFLTSQPAQFSFIPIAFKSPEALLSLQQGAGVDIWSFGCIAFELLTGQPLFQISDMEGEYFEEEIRDEHFSQMSQIIGPLPEWIVHAGHGHDPGIESEQDHDDILEQLELAFLRKKPADIKKVETEQILELLRKTLCYDPAHREPVSSLLRHRWFADS